MDVAQLLGDHRRMIPHAITALLIVVAIIHLAPVLGFFVPSALTKLYGIDASQADLQILLRHRAVLFGLLGAFFGYAAFQPPLQPIAFVGAAVSVTSFLFLAAAVGDHGPAIRKIAIADVGAAVCLLGAVGLYAVDRWG